MYVCVSVCVEAVTAQLPETWSEHFTADGQKCMCIHAYMYVCMCVWKQLLRSCVRLGANISPQMARCVCVYTCIYACVCMCVWKL